MQYLEQRIKAYADARWPDRTIHEKRIKLKEEVDELQRAIFHGHSADHVAKEIADCAIILSDMAQLIGMSLQGCVALKVPILEKRLENIRNGRPEKEGE